MQKFSAQEAFEASEDGEPIEISAKAALRIIEKHNTDAFDFFAQPGVAGATWIDAAIVFEWLGY
jgi:hypothetical protein